MKINLELAKQCLNELYGLGVREVVICPGARCAPLLVALESTKDFKVFSHFDERSAGFFALGLIQASNRPVAVITTSGTAVSELLSPVVEGHYNELPLIVLSADRPKSYRGSGAPQTIEQTQIFNGYVEWAEDIDDVSFTLPKMSGRRPIHINMCFDEPLVEKETAQWECSQNPNHKKVFPSQENPDEGLGFSPNSFSKPIVFVSGSHGFPKDLVLQFLQEAGLPVFLESTSGLKGHSSIANFEIQFPDLALKMGYADSVIRIGHIPTHRVWRDLESKKFPVLNLSHKSFSGLSWAKEVYDLNKQNLNKLIELKNSNLKTLIAEDRTKRSLLDEILIKFPLSEPALIQKLQNYWSPNQMVYLGNSLPIREWDLVSNGHRCFSKVYANRGANGIDGQVSTFLGLGHQDDRSLGVFGDLTTLYDLNAPWVLKDIASRPFIAVVNNMGGKIFERMFKSPLFQNRHERQFQHWSKMWDLGYVEFDGENSPFQAEGGVIEITPDEKETKLFWEALA